MNIQVRKTIRLNSHSANARNILLASLLALSATSAFAADSFYHKTLFEPSDSMLKAESRGRIMIYDSMDSETVDRAMDEQFDRIDSMMFVRTHYIEASGDNYVDDDGCD